MAVISQNTSISTGEKGQLPEQAVDFSGDTGAVASAGTDTGGGGVVERAMRAVTEGTSTANLRKENEQLRRHRERRAQLSRGAGSPYAHAATPSEAGASPLFPHIRA